MKSGQIEGRIEVRLSKLRAEIFNLIEANKSINSDLKCSSFWTNWFNNEEEEVCWNMRAEDEAEGESEDEGCWDAEPEDGCLKNWVSGVDEDRCFSRVECFRPLKLDN